MQITSVEAVIEKLGGYKAVSAMCGKTPHASLMWIARGSFPPRTFIILTDALKPHSAPPELWGMDTPRVRRNGKGHK